MKPEEVIARLESHFPGVLPKRSWGETAFFYNPGRRLPNGVYFCTIKEKDGANDTSSNLNREGVFRLSIGVPVTTYENLFGPRPGRPEKGGIVKTGHDFTKRNTIMPHPVYAWMGWICVLSPGEATYRKVLPLMEAAYEKAKVAFEKKVHAL